MHRIFIFAGLALLGAGLYWPKLYRSFQAPQFLAKVISSKGHTQWISRRDWSTSKAKKSVAVEINESLSTGLDGEMVLRFKRGAEVRLLPNTFITLLRKANTTLIALRRGEIEVIKDGEEDSVLVSDQGEDKALRDYQAKTYENTLWIDPASLDSVKSVDTLSAQNLLTITAIEGQPHEEVSKPPLRWSKNPLAAPSEKMTQDFQTQIRTMISDRVQRQKNHLYRCYSTLIQKQKMAHGKLNLHFVVTGKGKVESILLLQSDIKDVQFEKCLTQVIRRIEFQSFQGEKVSTFLPLRFEKNLQSLE